MASVKIIMATSSSRESVDITVKRNDLILAPQVVDGSERKGRVKCMRRVQCVIKWESKGQMKGLYSMCDIVGMKREMYEYSSLHSTCDIVGTNREMFE